MTNVLIPKWQMVVGWLLTVIPVLMLLVSAALKFMGGTQLEEGFAHLGWPLSLAIPLGVLELACTAVFLTPRTAILGAVLLTGYLGGATATHVRVGDPFIAPVILGAMLWGGLFFRSPRIRALIPLID
ncbi:DoxX family protein [Bryobacter aggregatus]|uniref:DoxX family protein n=1 Tax=Bryobacter aggregatus TaxID=360054 RepID=UPI0004E20CA7|nr:DoxX family protein [Bryobacter aggregatus]